MVPVGPIEISGSLSPSGTVNGVLLKVRLPIEVTPLAKAVEDAITNARSRAVRT
jgi:hypothetical protein